MSVQIQNVDSNVVSVPDNVTIYGSIKGFDNVVRVASSRAHSKLHVQINGNGNLISIGDVYQIKDLHVACGNHVPADNTSLTIGKAFSIEPGSSFLLYNSENRLSIGDDCLFSNQITIRCGESPHLIFNAVTGEYLDRSDGVRIGNHVWIGEQTYITKRASIGNGSIIAACSVVTRRFTEENCVIGGNPATIIKRDIHWVRNVDFLAKGSAYEASYNAYREEVKYRNREPFTNADAKQSDGPTST